LTHRFSLTLALLTLGATVLIQAPGLISLATHLESARRSRVVVHRAGLTSSGAPDLARWSQAVPVAAADESAKFEVRMQALVAEADCTLQGLKEIRFEEIAQSPGLSRADSTLRVAGTYAGLLKLLGALRSEPRILAVVKSSIRPTTHPQLVAEFVVRRYIRRAASYTAEALGPVSSSAKVDPPPFPLVK
jgi:hypothetical protein